MIHTRCGDELTADDVYRVWRIRDAVFAFEQHVDDVDVDGRDLLATTTHVWTADEAGLASYLRILSSVKNDQIGRVCTRVDQRNAGLATILLRWVIDNFDESRLCLNAQGHLESWYVGLGFRRSGADFDEASIRHVPMRYDPNNPRSG